MVSQATFLYRMQVFDQTLTKRRARLAEIKAILGKDEQVVEARNQLEAAEKALKPWHTRARDLDLEIQSVAQKIKTTDQTLYSGKISNPKALQDMQDEIASLKRRQSQLEDQLLEAMLQGEEGQTAVAGTQKQLNEVQALWKGTQVDLLAEQQRLESEVATLEAQRKEAAAAIDRDSLNSYETLRAKKHGQAVALMEGDSCIFCGVEQTSMIAQKVRQGKELIYCGSCGRILATSA